MPPERNPPPQAERADRPGYAWAPSQYKRAYGGGPAGAHQAIERGGIVRVRAQRQTAFLDCAVRIAGCGGRAAEHVARTREIRPQRDRAGCGFRCFFKLRACLAVRPDVPHPGQALVEVAQLHLRQGLRERAVRLARVQPFRSGEVGVRPACGACAMPASIIAIRSFTTITARIACAMELFGARFNNRSSSGLARSPPALYSSCAAPASAAGYRRQFDRPIISRQGRAILAQSGQRNRFQGEDPGFVRRGR